jgi:hypothetical protein
LEQLRTQPYRMLGQALLWHTARRHYSAGQFGMQSTPSSRDADEGAIKGLN